MKHYTKLHNHGDKIMNNEINAIELSDLELDVVAGGFALSIGEGQNLSLGTHSSFEQNILQVGQETFSGPNGSGTKSLFNVSQIFTEASQNFGIGN
jgi:hypothetical protein